MNLPEFSAVDASKWLVGFPSPPSNPKARLICFHWAGGNGFAFRPWAKSLQTRGIEVRSMMLPGRLSRSKEPLVTDVKEIVGKFYLPRSI